MGEDSNVLPGDDEYDSDEGYLEEPHPEQTACDASTAAEEEHFERKDSNVASLTSSAKFDDEEAKQPLPSKHEESDSDSDELGRWTQVLSTTKPLPKKMPCSARASLPKEDPPFARPSLAPHLNHRLDRSCSSTSSFRPHHQNLHSSPMPQTVYNNFQPKDYSSSSSSSSNLNSHHSHLMGLDQKFVQQSGSALLMNGTSNGFAGPLTLPTMPPLPFGHCPPPNGRSGGDATWPNQTSTGLRPEPPPMSTFRSSRRCPLPGPAPPGPPPAFALLPPCLDAPVTTLALTWPGHEALSTPQQPTLMAHPNVSTMQIQPFVNSSSAMLGAYAPLAYPLLPTPSLPPAISSSIGAGGFYSGTGDWLTALPPSLAVERIVDVSEIRFSQRSMRNRFQDGRSFEELIRALQMGDPRCNPMTAEFLKLIVVEKADASGQRALYSKDNRRLWCLKEFQKREGSRPVPVRVRILPWHDVLEACKFSKNYDTENDGREISVRDF